MRKLRHSNFYLAAAVICTAMFSATPSHATVGYFQPGFSANQKAVAGAGSANPEGAMTIAVNPAGIVLGGANIEASLSLFKPYRGYTVSGGPGFVAPGEVNSGWESFVIPGFAISQAIDDHSSWGLAVYGNGGMNTTYPAAANPACLTGVFCAGKAGVNLNQMFVSAAYAWKSGDISLGVAPVFALQMFSAKGLGAFSALSASPADLTDRGLSYSYGGGVRFGVLWQASSVLRLSLAGATPIWMSSFGKYEGLFADRGSFDIPANVTAGLAWDAAPDWTVMLDVQHIFYSAVDAIGNSSHFTGTLFGAAGGPGFGWKDVDNVSLGVVWRVTSDWTLRAGAAANSNPVASSDVTMNILAPGVVTNHFAGGVSRKVSEHSSIDLAVLYAPGHAVHGIEWTPAGPNSGRDIGIAMHQWDFTIGYRYTF